MKNKKVFLALTLICVLLMLAACSQQPKSAYDIAVENGFQGSEQDWLASIKGDEGKSAYRLYCELFGYEGTEEQWLIDLRTGALISFRVTFDLNGGQAPDGFVSSMTVRGGSFLDLKVPTKEGYTFLGWYTGDGDTDFAMTATTAVRSDLSLKAKWRSNVMSVRFLDKDGKLLKQETVPYGGAATAPQAPEVAQFLFNKWDVDFSVVTEDLIVKAVYSPLYKLSFNTNGGTMIADATYCAEDIPVAPMNPRKEGLVFRGWYADKEFTVPYDFSTPLTQNTTIYAYFSDLKPISNAEELKAIGDNSTGKFYLTNDIDLSGEIWTPLNGFAGEFDGQGYKIHNFIISETKSAGFFVSNSGTIQNLTLADFTVCVSTQSIDSEEYDFESFAGTLVGNNEGAVNNCHVRDSVLTYDLHRNIMYSTLWYEDNAYIGGLVGSNSGVVLDCTVDIVINATVNLYVHGPGTRGTYGQKLRLYVGGVSGDNQGKIKGTSSKVITAGSAIVNSISGYKAWPEGYDEMQSEVFLFVGGNSALNSGVISHSESKIEFTGSASESKPVSGFATATVRFGGFAQENLGTITKCTTEAVCLMKTDNPDWWALSAGGFADVNKTEITNCYANAIIKTQGTTNNATTDSSIGGFVAFNQGTITFSYTTYEIDTHVLTTVGGFVGRNEKSATIMKCIADGNIVYTGEPLGVGSFIGVKDDGSTLFKNYYSAESTILQGETDVTAADSQATAQDRATMQTSAFLIDILGYNTEVWEIVDGQYPTLIESK